MIKCPDLIPNVPPTPFPKRGIRYPRKRVHGGSVKLSISCPHEKMGVQRSKREHAPISPVEVVISDAKNGVNIK